MKSRRENQFHKEVQRRRLGFWVKTILLVVFVCIMIASFFDLFFFSSVFKIKTITISGTRYVSAKAIETRLNGLKNESIFVAKLDSAGLIHAFPLIESVDMEKEFPSSVRIAVHEYPPYMLIQTPLATAVTSANGLVVDTVNNASGKYNLPLIVVDETDPTKLPLKEIAMFVGKIESDKKDFITSFSFSLPAKLTAQYADGHQVIFSLNKDIDTQMSQMLSVRQLVGFTKCPVLDVRFDNIYCSGS